MQPRVPPSGDEDSHEVCLVRLWRGRLHGGKGGMRGERDRVRHFLHAALAGRTWMKPLLRRQRIVIRKELLLSFR